MLLLTTITITCVHSARQAAARVDKKRESPSLEILERVRALTLAGQQRAAAGGFEGFSFQGSGHGTAGRTRVTPPAPAVPPVPCRTLLSLCRRCGRGVVPPVVQLVRCPPVCCVFGVMVYREQRAHHL